VRILTQYACSYKL